MTTLWVIVDMGKVVSSEFIGRAMGLPMTLGYLRLILSMHPMCYSIGYKYVSEATLYILVFYCLGSFINCLFITNALSTLMPGSYKGLVFQELQRMWVSYRPH